MNDLYNAPVTVSFAYERGGKQFQGTAKRVGMDDRHVAYDLPGFDRDVDVPVDVAAEGDDAVADYVANALSPRSTETFEIDGLDPLF